MIEEPTRKENTLDLMFTNESSIVTVVEVTDSSYSDHNHNIIEMSTNYLLTEEEKCNIEQSEDTGFRSLNFRTKTVKWKNINGMIENIDWDKEFESRDAIAGTKKYARRDYKMC